MPDELRAVHFVIDREHADRLSEEWRRLGLARLPLELIDVPDRRARPGPRSSCAPRTCSTARPRSACSSPARVYRRFWHRLLHDHTGDAIAAAVAGLPHANVTFVPYQLGAPSHHDELEAT